jgi:hypothetical protein
MNSESAYEAMTKYNDFDLRELRDGQRVEGREVERGEFALKIDALRN